jgi:dienelactone hydrolase
MLASGPAAAQMAELAVKFGAREAFDGVRLSPDGTRISYLNPISRKSNVLVVVDIATGTVKPILSSGTKDQMLAWCDWVKNDRLMCGARMTAQKAGYVVARGSLVAVDADGGDIKEIDRCGGQVLDKLPESPDEVLISPGCSNSVQRANIRSSKWVYVTGERTAAAMHQSDKRGNVRLKGLAALKDGASGERYIGERMRYFYRTKAGGDWVPLGVAELKANSTLSVHGFDETGDNLFVMKPRDGRQALYRVAADGSNAETLVFAHPKVDVSGVVRIGKYDRPIGAAYSTDYDHVEYFDPVLAKLAANIGKALPGAPQVNILDESWDGSKLLIFVGSDTEPGAYYLYDRKTRQLGKLSSERPALDGVPLGARKPVTYPARDGTPIPAYLTLPPGQTAKGLPVVIMPHGGPSSRDTFGFDWLSQYFAKLGYAVLQPNYRGSAGYGEAWFQENGFKAWRTAIGDINDGARWLVAQGIGDANRLAIFGWSYGGYAALQANVLEPDLYKATVAVAPVTDLQQLKTESRFWSGYLLEREFIGTGPHIIEGSPARNAAAIKTPVLMFHGTLDLNVDIAQSRRMESALKNAGKPVELVVYDDLQHSLIDSFARADLLLRSGKFLSAHVK